MAGLSEMRRNPVGVRLFVGEGKRAPAEVIDERSLPVTEEEAADIAPVESQSVKAEVVAVEAVTRQGGIAGGEGSDILHHRNLAPVACIHEIVARGVAFPHVVVEKGTAVHPRRIDATPCNARFPGGSGMLLHPVPVNGLPMEAGQAGRHHKQDDGTDYSSIHIWVLLVVGRQVDEGSGNSFSFIR